MHKYQSLQTGQLPQEHLPVIYLWILLLQNIYLPHLPKSPIYEVMTSLPPEAKYPIEPIERGLPAVEILMFLAS